MKAAKSSPAIERCRRRAELAAIHVAVKQLGWDEATYRDFLFATTGHRSAAELSDGQRQEVIELLRSRGFKRTPAEEKRARRMADNRQIAMIHGLWTKLCYAGAIKDASEVHLRNFVRKQTGVGAIEWLNVEQCIAIIEAMKNWLRRVVAKTEPAA